MLWTVHAATQQIYLDITKSVHMIIEQKYGAERGTVFKRLEKGSLVCCSGGGRKWRSLSNGGFGSEIRASMTRLTRRGPNRSGRVLLRAQGLLFLAQHVDDVSDGIGYARRVYTDDGRLH